MLQYFSEGVLINLFFYQPFLDAPNWVDGRGKKYQWSDTEEINQNEILLCLNCCDLFLWMSENFGSLNCQFHGAVRWQLLALDSFWLWNNQFNNDLLSLHSKLFFSLGTSNETFFSTAAIIRDTSSQLNFSLPGV